ncbi:hypothetical protein OG613_48640 (plasmid) [Streptomyces sp. NBC_00015]|uniref:hypothetical protein n=1 Tax=Streptomyces sp. NBC_00015 TaxID=2903611 RepID=UPI002F908A0B
MAVTAPLEDIATDRDSVGLDACDVRKVVTAVLRHEPVLNETAEPRRPAGDLWLPNTLLDHQGAKPVITDTYDFDRT